MGEQDLLHMFGVILGILSRDCMSMWWTQRCGNYTGRPDSPNLGIQYISTTSNLSSNWWFCLVSLCAANFRKRHTSILTSGRRDGSGAKHVSFSSTFSPDTRLFKNKIRPTPIMRFKFRGIDSSCEPLSCIHKRKNTRQNDLHPPHLSIVTPPDHPRLTTANMQTPSFNPAPLLSAKPTHMFLPPRALHRPSRP